MQIVAAESNFPEGIALLHENGFSVNQQHPRTRATALHHGVRCSCAASVEELLVLGADTAIVSRDYNSTPLSLALRRKDQDMTALLLSHGRVHGASVPGVDWVEDPAIFVCAARGDAAGLQALVDAGGVDVDRPTKGTYSPLHLACVFGHTATVQALLGAGARQDVKCDWKYHPMHFTAMLETTDCLNLLLEALPGLDDAVRASILNDTDLEGHTPLALAVYYKRPQNALLLMQAGADPNVLDRSGGTLLHYCGSEGEAWAAEMIDMLMAHGVSRDVVDTRGDTALGCTAKGSCFDTLACLLRHGADVLGVGSGTASPAAILAEKCADHEAPGCDAAYAALVEQFDKAKAAAEEGPEAAERLERFKAIMDGVKDPAVARATALAEGQAPAPMENVAVPPGTA